MKRIFDFVCAVILLIIFMIPIMIISFIIRAKIGTPILFRQYRPGKNGEVFEMIKFRTMTDAIDEKGVPLSDSERMTQLGSFLRSSSLDELPELWNVIRGQMSLVGPRPLLVEYLPLYTKEQAKRHNVRPGITGWAQVNGRNAISWVDKFALDIWYVENQSFWLDLRILWMTLQKVLVRDGINAQGDATMPAFMGSKID